jgi:hypothetical protein
MASKKAALELAMRSTHRQKSPDECHRLRQQQASSISPFTSVP